jgi:hypothetical protein
MHFLKSDNSAIIAFAFVISLIVFITIAYYSTSSQSNTQTPTSTSPLPYASIPEFSAVVMIISLLVATAISALVIKRRM